MRLGSGSAVPGSPTDYYQVLGVPRDAPHGVIRDAFVRLSRRHHPDLAGELPRRLREVQQAYRCLANAATRAEHDLMLQRAESAHHRRQLAVLHRLHRHDGRAVASASHGRGRRRERARARLAVVVGLALVLAAVLVAQLPA